MLSLFDLFKLFELLGKLDEVTKVAINSFILSSSILSNLHFIEQGGNIHFPCTDSRMDCFGTLEWWCASVPLYIFPRVG